MRPAFVVCALVPCAIVAACESFSSTSEEEAPPTVDGGGDAPASDGGADAPATRDAGGDAGNGPVLVAASSAPIPWVTYDATRVIWATGKIQAGGTGDLFACPKVGCPDPVTPLATGQPNGYLATTGTTAFVSYAFGSRGIERIEASGARTVMAGVTAKNALFNLYVEGGSLLFVAYAGGDGGASFPRSVYSVPVTDGPQTSLGVFEDEGTNSANMVATSDRVFIGAHNIGRIVTCPRAGGSFSDYGAGNDFYVSSLATDGQRLYWTTLDALVSCAAGAACAAPTVELSKNANDGAVLSVEHRDGLLYLQRSNGDLVECVASACASTTRVIAHEDSFFVAELSARNLVVDDAFVYYVAKVGSDTDAGTASYRLMRVARTPR